MNWQNTTFLVTGGAGFLGTNVVQKLYEHGAVRVFVPRSADYDLRQDEAVKAVFQDSMPDIVIHLAAIVGGIGANRARAAEFFYDNLSMGIRVMDQAWRSGVRKFVSIGTVCAYPKYTPVPFSENALWDGYPEETNAPYGLAKKMLLVQGQAYRQQYGFNAIYLLPTNLYGPGDNFEPDSSHVIPALIRKCIEARENGDEQIVAWGTGSPTREFLYVEDAAEGIVLATEHYDDPEPVNLGSGVEISIRELTDLVMEFTSFKGKAVWDTTKPDGQPRRALNTVRAELEFGFRAKTRFRDGLKRTVDWYEAQRVEGMYATQAT